jgi:hypothetical protein
MLVRLYLPLVLLGCLASTGCRTWGTSEGYTWKIKAPAKVEKTIRESNQLVFQAETYLPSGEAAESISFFWVITWVGLQGWDHKGKSFQDQSIRVKGQAGTAYISIYAYNNEDKLVQVAKQPFEVVVP